MGFDKETEQEKVKVDKKVEKKEEKEEKVKERFLVVKELPVQAVRESMDEETNINTTFITHEEALTRMFEKIIGGDL